MSDHCHACGVSLHLPEFKGSAEEYCKYCIDAAGKLKDRDEVRKGIAHWLKSWSPNLTDEQAYNRAGHYMKAMPAWAE